jgi:hypothetical protein
VTADPDEAAAAAADAAERAEAERCAAAAEAPAGSGGEAGPVVGDEVQWVTAGGVRMFTAPRIIESVQVHSGVTYATLEGERSGVLYEQLERWHQTAPADSGGRVQQAAHVAEEARQSTARQGYRWGLANTGSQLAACLALGEAEVAAAVAVGRNNPHWLQKYTDATFGRRGRFDNHHIDAFAGVDLDGASVEWKRLGEGPAKAVRLFTDDGFAGSFSRGP